MTEGQWHMTLDEYDDGEGVLSFSIDLDEDEVKENPRALLRALIAVATYVLDHDLLDEPDD